MKLSTKLEAPLCGVGERLVSGLTAAWACDDVHYSFRCRFHRLLVAAHLALGECVLAFV